MGVSATLLLWYLTTGFGEEITKSEMAEGGSETVSVKAVTEEIGHSAQDGHYNYALLLPEGTKLIMEATAYTSGYESTGKKPGDPDYGITFSGLPAMRGAVAVDPKVIPLHSVLLIEEYGYAVALDTGSAIKGNRVDVYFDDPQRARAWGRRQVEVQLISRGEVRNSNGQR